MNVQVEKRSHSEVRLTIQVPASDMAGYFARAYERLSRTVSVKGFRPGRAPQSIVLEQIGRERYQQEALNLAVLDTYQCALIQEKLRPVGDPKIEVEHYGVDEELRYHATLDVFPTITLGDYTKLRPKLPKEEPSVTDEEVATILGRLQSQAATFTDVDRPTAEGDRIEINFTGTVKGVVQDDLVSQHYPLILGETSLVPGFEQHLVGLTKGDETSFTLTIEKRRVEFAVECLAVQSVALPVLDATFATQFGHESLEALKQAIRTSLELEKQERHQHLVDEAVLEALRTTTTVEVPTSLVEEEISRRIQALRTRLGPGFEFMLKQRKQTIEQLRSSLADEARQSVEAGLILGEVARAENLIPEGGVTTNEMQQAVVRKTLDKLVEYTKH